MIKKTGIRLHFWALFIGMSLCLASSSFAADVQQCGSLYRQKMFVKAGMCFEQIANAMGETTQLSKIQKYLKGQNLRNAALSYRKAATTEQNVEKAAYRYEQALLILRRYLKENLCQKQYLCKLAKGELLELINKIKYVQLSIITTPKKKAVLHIQGYKYDIQHFSPPQWNKQVRPGRYKIKVQYEGKKPIVKEIIAIPGKALTVTMLLPTKVIVKRIIKRIVSKRSVPKKQLPLPKPKTKLKLLPFLIAGGGLLLVGTGAAILIYGKSKQTARDQIYEELKIKTLKEQKSSNVEDLKDFAKSNELKSRREQMDALHQEAAGLLFPGWLFVGIGSAIVATGLTLHAIDRISHLKKKSKQNQPPKPPQTKQTRSQLKSIHFSF